MSNWWSGLLAWLFVPVPVTDVKDNKLVTKDPVPEPEKDPEEEKDTQMTILPLFGVEDEDD